jgi:MFS family permease
MADSPQDQIAAEAEADAARPDARQRLPRPFWRLWTAAMTSGVGDGLRMTALPLLAASISDRPTSVAAVTAVGTAPWLLFGLFAGVLVDRNDRRRLMWIIDMARALVSLVFVVLLFDVHHLGLLLAFAFVMGSAQTVFTTASSAFLPSIVPPRALALANSRLLGVQVLVTQLIGPAAAGFLFVLSAKLPFAIDALTFLVSSLLVLTLRSEKRDAVRRHPASGMVREAREGLRWLLAQPLLRAQSGMFVGLSVVSGMLLAVFVLYVKNVLHLSSSVYGLLMAALAIGSILGSAIVPILRVRLGPSACLLCSVVATVLALVILGTLRYVPAATIAMVILGIASIVWLIVTISIRQEIVPDAMLGRVTSTYRMLGSGSTPLGAGAAAIATRWVALPTLFLAGAAFVAVCVLLFRRAFVDVASEATR